MWGGAEISSRPMRSSLMLVVLVVLPVVSGCAARAGYFMLNAERKYNNALDEGAMERAPYEATLAGAYLDKAREEIGYSDYGVAEKLCKRSMELSATALTKSEDLTPVKDPEKFVPEVREKEPEKEPEPDVNLDINLDE